MLIDTIYLKPAISKETEEKEKVNPNNATGPYSNPTTINFKATKGSAIKTIKNS